jgi:hypothetical protein
MLERWYRCSCGGMSVIMNRFCTVVHCAQCISQSLHCARTPELPLDTCSDANYALHPASMRLTPNDPPFAIIQTPRYFCWWQIAHFPRGCFHLGIDCWRERATGQIAPATPVAARKIASIATSKMLEHIFHGVANKTRVSNGLLVALV